MINFLRESLRIEGIHRDPTPVELQATKLFVGLDTLRVIDIERLVSIYQPDARLRDKVGLDVRVGSHIAPPGGPRVRAALEELVVDANASVDSLAHPSRKLNASPFTLHLRYEAVHPFTDGNGRSGRAIWLWQMTKLCGGAPLGFLHHFYYQTLETSR